MRNENTLVINFALAMLLFCLVYYLNFSSPRYYPLEGLWRWENKEGLPAMSWYARFGWSLTASGGAALLGHFLIPPVLRVLSAPNQQRACVLVGTAALLMYVIAAISVILHEVHTRF